MLVKHGSREYRLPDEWWTEAGMKGFRPSRTSFVVAPGGCTLPVLEVPFSDVAPCWRELSHGVFNDNPVEGTARDRVVRILEAFRGGVALPPVEVVRSAPGSGYRFQLHHGVHRFYSAIAAGFSAVPVIDVTDELVKI